MDCPRCGHPEAEGPECPRCGVVFAKLRRPRPVEEVPPAAPTEAAGRPPAPPPAPPGPVPYRPSAPVVKAPAPVAVGGILSEVFSTYFSNFGSFFLVTLLVFSPVFGSFLVRTSPSGAVPFSRGWIFGGLLLGLLCGAVATAAITYGVFLHLRRRTGSVLDCLKGGLSALLPVSIVSLAQTLILGLGLVLCLVPGLAAMAHFALAVPATVEERLGPVAALRRSQKLTKGARWQVLAIFVLLGGLQFAVRLVAEGAYALFAGWTITQLLRMQQAPIGLLLFSTFAALVPLGLSATASAVLYYRLRSAKESIDVQDLVSLFD